MTNADYSNVQTMNTILCIKKCASFSFLSHKCVTIPSDLSFEHLNEHNLVLEWLDYTQLLLSITVNC